MNFEVDLVANASFDCGEFDGRFVTDAADRFDAVAAGGDGDLVLSPTFGWQQRFPASGIDPEPRRDIPVEAKILDDLSTLAEFRRPTGVADRGP